MTDEQTVRLRGAAADLFTCEDSEVLICGPAGTGKTRGCLTKAHYLCDTYPGVRGLFLRQVKADLAQSVLVTWEEKVLYPNHPVLQISGDAQRKNRDSYLYPPSENEVNGKFYSGQSEIVVSGLDRPERTFSMEYDFVVVFEGIEISEKSWEKLIRVNRNHRMPFQQLILDTNPGPKTHWANVRADEPYAIPEPLKDVLPPARKGQTRMTRLKSKHKDNPFLWDQAAQTWTPEGADYMGKLYNMSGHIRDRMLHGRWVTAEGMIWEVFDPDLHMVDLVKREADGFYRGDEGELQFKWMFAAMDWGFVHAGVLQIWGVDEDDRMFRVAEWYRSGKGSEWWADRVVQALQEYPIQTIVADPSRPDMIQLINQKTSPMCGRHGEMMVTKADNDLTSGLDLVREALSQRKLFFVRGATKGGPCPVRMEHKAPTKTEDEILNFIWKRPLTERGMFKEEPISETQWMSFDGCACTRYAAKRAFLTDLTPTPKPRKYPDRSFGKLLKHAEVLSESEFGL